MRLKSTTSDSAANSATGASLESAGLSSQLDSSVQPSSSPVPDQSPEQSEGQDKHTDHQSHTESTENKELHGAAAGNRVFNQPNHTYFSTANSMWNIMDSLDLLRYDDSLMLLMQMKRWDQWLVEWIEHQLVSSESEAMCILLQQMFNALRLPLTPEATRRTDAQTRLIQH